VTPAVAPSTRGVVIREENGKAKKARVLQTQFAIRRRMTDAELLNWIRTGETDGMGYTTEGIDYAQRGDSRGRR